MKNKTKRKNAPGGGRPRLAIHRDAVIQLRVRPEEKAELAAAAADAGISLTEFIMLPALARAHGQRDKMVSITSVD